ncbi:polyphosphate kinase 1 [Cupriavidus taiwanensis]|nr:polyphosphate kinase 1 [Cupriavidus taiwanensis]SOY43461.1 polyphosphate kinase, component of RNA degradosome [Cupriavidus taiwanensis]SOZ76240.1 polyphosphate kinase, component of RNA degradosome [Cupriavidus taiwanensis]SOZ76768.1 polyphosphate kinase, component of RNA degradosome [Cupriavidus taiwanensis]SPA10684.1 polyphosphate kinase, component of RNA degradosome [Cupriavidus taiwanensis]
MRHESGVMQDESQGPRGGEPADEAMLPNGNARHINRELSQLEFFYRVLQQAADPAIPLLERLRALCTFSSNLDEFYEVRVAGLKEQCVLTSPVVGPDGLTPQAVYAAVNRRVRELVEQQYGLFNDVLIPALAQEQICFLRRPSWNARQQDWIREFFFAELMPVLTPIRLDPAHPFPRVLNKSLNFAVELEGKDAFGRSSGNAIVQAPRALPRVIALPAAIAGCRHGFVFLSSILHAHVGELFSGMTVRGCYQFRVTRNSQLFVDEEEVKNLREALQGELPHRHLGDAVRLEVADNCPPAMTAFLQQQFGLAPGEVFAVNGPVNLVRLMQVPDQVDRPELKYLPFRPGLPKALLDQPDVFRAMRDGDILLHHPFQSFAPVVDFVRQAAQDPDVVAISQTVYRAGHDSALLSSLIDAARHGKEVTAVVELMARFDEEANIGWAAQLEEVGAHVVYGVVGFKAHAKILMVVRREDGRLRRYVHLGTGNYHHETSRSYTDFGLLTCDESLTRDVAQVFSQLTGRGQTQSMTHIWQSPFTLKQQLLAAIRGEAEHARAGRKGRIIAKMNALLEPELIEALYDASGQGVHIDLIIRGACALRPGIAGLSEHITVKSVMGRFLEHSRIFCFHDGGADKVMLSSGEWMERSLSRRIEICFPVLDPRLKQRIIAEGLEPYLSDQSEAWRMTPEGNYVRQPVPDGESAQRRLLAALT